MKGWSKEELRKIAPMQRALTADEVMVDLPLAEAIKVFRGTFPPPWDQGGA